MDIKTRKASEVCVVEVRGEVKLGPATQALRETVKQQVDAGEKLVVLDMGGVPWLDSSGIGETVACRNRVVDVGGKIAIVLQGKSHDLFTNIELSKVLTIHGTVEEALGSLATSV